MGLILPFLVAVLATTSVLTKSKANIPPMKHFTLTDMCGVWYENMVFMDKENPLYQSSGDCALQQYKCIKGNDTYIIIRNHQVNRLTRKDEHTNGCATYKNDMHNGEILVTLDFSGVQVEREFTIYEFTKEYSIVYCFFENHETVWVLTSDEKPSQKTKDRITADLKKMHKIGGPNPSSYSTTSREKCPPHDINSGDDDDNQHGRLSYNHKELYGNHHSGAYSPSGNGGYYGDDEPDYGDYGVDYDDGEFDYGHNGDDPYYGQGPGQDGSYGSSQHGPDYDYPNGGYYGNNRGGPSNNPSGDGGYYGGGGFDHGYNSDGPGHAGPYGDRDNSHHGPGQDGSYGGHDGSYGGHGSPYGHQDGPYGGQDGPYNSPDGPYGGYDGSYGGHGSPYGHQDGPYGGQDGPYNSPDGPYGGYDGSYGGHDDDDYYK